MLAGMKSGWKMLLMRGSSSLLGNAGMEGVQEARAAVAPRRWAVAALHPLRTALGCAKVLPQHPTLLRHDMLCGPAAIDGCGSVCGKEVIVPAV